MTGFEEAIGAVLNAQLVLPEEAFALAQRFDEAGLELYVVGGAVRDALIGRQTPPDLDFATDARPEVTKRLLEGWAEAIWTQGEAFGSIGALRNGHRFEVTTFRADEYAPHSRKPDVAEAADIQTDLSRRDFTVNAMALRLPDRRFFDPFGGANDLTAKLLRTPGAPQESFSDDPLRMLRAARFVSQLGLAPAPEVIDAMRAMSSRISIVSADRIREELLKLLAGDLPWVGFELMTETGLSELLLPELPALKLEQDPIHQHKDVYAHSLAVLKRICEHDAEAPDATLRLAGLLHDIGKPATRRIDADGVSFHHHDVVGARMARERLRTLAFPNDQIEEIAKLIELHLRFHTFRMGWTDSAVRRYARDAGPLLDRLNILVRCDCTTRNRRKARELMAAMDAYELRLAEVRAQEDLDAIRPQLDGNQIMAYLGIPPGRMVGEARELLLEHRLEHGEVAPDDLYALLDRFADEHGLDAPRVRTD